MTRPAIVLYASQIGMSPFEIGLLVATYAALPAATAIHAGILADRFGDRIPVIGGFIASAVGLFLPYVFKGAFWLYASQVLFGIGQLCVATSAQNLIGLFSKPQDRDRNFSFSATVVSIGGFAGPFIGGLIAQHLSFTAVFIVGGIIAVVGAILGLAVPHRPRGKPGHAMSMRASAEHLTVPAIRRALVTGTLIQYSRDVFVTYFPLYGEQLGLSPFLIGIILSIQGFSLLLARAAVPILLRWVNRDTVLVGSIVLSGLAFAIIPLTDLIAVSCSAAFLMGFGLASGQPISMTEAFNSSPSGRTGEVLGMRQMWLRLGQLIAPVLLGSIGSGLGLASVFYANGAVLLGGGFAIRWKPPR